MRVSVCWRSARAEASTGFQNMRTASRNVRDLPRTLRCPLCAQNIVVASEAECEAHIANCKGFHSEFGPGTSRSGLVTGFEDATSAVPAPPARAPEPSGSDERMEKIAEALAPLVPVARAESSAHTLEEAVDLVAHLAAALVSSAGEGTVEDFGIEELVSVTLGPFITPLGEQQAKHVLGGITAALAAWQGAPSGFVGMGAGADLSETLRRSLLRRHAPPKPLPPPAATTTAAAGAGAAGAAAARVARARAAWAGAAGAEAARTAGAARAARAAEALAARAVAARAAVAARWVAAAAAGAVGGRACCWRGVRRVHRRVARRRARAGCAQATRALRQAWAVQGTRVMRVLAFLAFVERKRIHTRLRENTAHCCKNKVE